MKQIEALPTTMTPEIIKSMKYQELIKACPSMGVEYNFQKREALIELFLEKLSAPNKKATKPKVKSDEIQEVKEVAEELLDEVQEVISPKKVKKVKPVAVVDDYKVRLKEFHESCEMCTAKTAKNQEVVEGVFVALDKDRTFEIMHEDADLLERTRNGFNSNNGFLKVTAVQEGLAEMDVDNGNDIVVLPVEVLIVVDVPKVKKEATKYVDTGVVGSIGIDDIKKGYDPEKAVELFNEANDTNVHVIKVEKCSQGKNKSFTVVHVEYNKKKCQLSATKMIMAIQAGTLLDLIEKTEDVKPNASKDKKVKVITYTYNAEQQAIIANKELTKSDKIRRLLRSGCSVAAIAKGIKIHYSFAYCVVDKYRKMLIPNKSVKSAEVKEPAKADKKSEVKEAKEKVISKKKVAKK